MRQFAYESDILGLDFFSDAFELLKATGAVQLEASGKNAGCWVMPLEGTPEFAGLEDPDKVIVRSDGTVTYVGKAATFALMSAFPFILLGQWDSTWSTVIGACGWGFLIWGIYMYLWSFVLYVIQVSMVLRRLPGVPR